jgi:hypothetical protein
MAARNCDFLDAVHYLLGRDQTRNQD